MKTHKTFLFLAVMVLPLALLAQSVPISRNANLSVFTGYFAKRQNTNNNGYWVGAYGDLPLYRSSRENFNFGIWGLYAHSKWTDNLAQYSAVINDYALGFNGGYYDEFFSFAHAFYGGIAIGYKYSSEIGQVEKRDYTSIGQQRDHILTGNINLNLLKSSGYHPRFLPRTQLIFSGQISLNAQKVLSENDKPEREVDCWNKNYYEITLKQSIVDISLNRLESVFLQPKIGVQYSHYVAGDPDVYSYFAEIAFHKVGADDFLSLTFSQKFYPGTKDLLFIMLNLNILKLIK